MRSFLLHKTKIIKYTGEKAISLGVYRTRLLTYILSVTLHAITSAQLASWSFSLYSYPNILVHCLFLTFIDKLTVPLLIQFYSQCRAKPSPIQHRIKTTLDPFNSRFNTLLIRSCLCAIFINNWELTLFLSFFILARRATNGGFLENLLTKLSSNHGYVKKCKQMEFEFHS